VLGPCIVHVQRDLRDCIAQIPHFGDDEI
jgi:hypothetical protein